MISPFLASKWPFISRLSNYRILIISIRIKYRQLVEDKARYGKEENLGWTGNVRARGFCDWIQASFCATVAFWSARSHTCRPNFYNTKRKPAPSSAGFHAFLSYLGLTSSRSEESSALRSRSRLPPKTTESLTASLATAFIFRSSEHLNYLVMAPLLPASMAQYTYSTLKPSNFRFLILLPGDGDDIVNCLLQESIIRQPNSEYEALSYVWGDDKKPHLVLCEGKELAVTTSLWTALRRLRLPQERRTLWADAICINQADLGERADQVQLMRQIYDGAARVIIWLGEETDVMRRAFPLIDHFTISVSEYLDEVPDVYTPAVKHWVMERGRATFDSENQIVLQHFFENPWFLRAWVFQEAVCAKSAIVQCGGLQIDFEILELFATLFFVNELTTILPTAESRGSHHQLYAIRNVRRLYARGEKHTIFRLLAGSAGAGAKDPRDQLFSLARDCSRAAFTVPP